MPTYHVAFHYPGPYSNLPSEAASARLDKADETVVGALNSLKLDHEHEYMWTDGTLLKHVSSKLDEKELRAAIDAQLPDGYDVSEMVKLKNGKCQS